MKMLSKPVNSLLIKDLRKFRGVFIPIFCLSVAFPNYAISILSGIKSIRFNFYPKWLPYPPSYIRLKIKGQLNKIKGYLIIAHEYFMKNLLFDLKNAKWQRILSF